MEIKVNNTKIHVAIPPGSSMYHDIPVVEAKLVILPDDVLKRGDLDGRVGGLRPILISETEKMEKGDWVYSPKTGFILKVVDRDGDVYKGKTTHINTINTLIEIKDASRPFKILALPEHFSKEQLNMIVEGKLKDGDKLLVECKQGERYTDPECPIGIGGGYEYIIKSPLSIYPIEEKLYTRETVWYLIQKFWQEKDDSCTIDQMREWFDQNIK